MYETRRWVYHDEYPSMELKCVKTIQDDERLIKFYEFGFFDGEWDGDRTIYKIVTLKAHIRDDEYVQFGAIYTTSPYNDSWYCWSCFGEGLYYWVDEDGDIRCDPYDDGVDLRYEDFFNDNYGDFISILSEYNELGNGNVPEWHIIHGLLEDGIEDLKEEIGERLKEYSIIRQTLEFKEEDFKYLVEKGYTKY